MFFFFIFSKLKNVKYFSLEDGSHTYSVMTNIYSLCYEYEPTREQPSLNTANNQRYIVRARPSASPPSNPKKMNSNQSKMMSDMLAKTIFVE